MFRLKKTCFFPVLVARSHSIGLPLGLLKLLGTNEALGTAMKTPSDPLSTALLQRPRYLLPVHWPYTWSVASTLLLTAPSKMVPRYLRYLVT